ncbi:MAG TPA: TraB/GumN family protein [Flavobacterium sp.]|nr:TraB/GumN family protein [Flavobacterium sp.]
MTRKFFVALLLVGVSSFAQNEKSLLWKVSGNGLKQPSYLYGTIHATCDATLDKVTLTALDNTKQLYLEMDMDDPTLQSNMMAGMMMKDGKTMQSMVSAADFKTLDDYVKEKLGFSAVMLNTIKPFLVSAMFLPSLMDCPMQSVEEELMAVSHTQKEEVYGLETAADQLAVFDAIPYQAQMDELMEGVKNKFADDKSEMAKMNEIYKSKDINAMLDLTKESENDITSKYQDDLLNNRNKNWIPKIEAAAKEKPTFFGFGAGHLAGENGVIALLRKKGYDVEAVK